MVKKSSTQSLTKRFGVSSAKVEALERKRKELLHKITTLTAEINKLNKEAINAKFPQDIKINKKIRDLLLKRSELKGEYDSVVNVYDRASREYLKRAQLRMYNRGNPTIKKMYKTREGVKKTQRIKKQLRRRK